MTELSPNFICICGHRNKLHASKEDTEAWSKGSVRGRMCVEYKDAICIKGVWYHTDSEWICSCPNFVPDNLRTLETMSEKVVQETQI